MDVYSTYGLFGVGTARRLELYMFGICTCSEVKENRKTVSKTWAIVMRSLQAASTCISQRMMSMAMHWKEVWVARVWLVV